MEHILQFGINIDDNAIVEAVTRKAEREIVNGLKNRVEANIENALYAKSYYRNEKNLQSWVVSEFVNFLDKNKDEIIERASEKLADKLCRTKAVKEAVGNVLKEFDT